MIITNVFILHIPTTVLTFGSNGNLNNETFKRGYVVMEKLQMTGFCIQEFILSGLYIRETIRMLQISQDRRKRMIMWQLLSVNVLIIAMDIALVSIEFADLYHIQITLKGAIYSIKLKLEFAIFGKLIQVVNNNSWEPDLSSRPKRVPDFIDTKKMAADHTRAPRCAVAPPTPPWMHADDLTFIPLEPSVKQDEELGNRSDSDKSCRPWIQPTPK